MAVLLDAIAEAETEDASATQSSTDAIVEALDALGFEPVPVSLHGDRSSDWVASLAEGDFRLAFNLCESMDGQASGEHRPAATAELLGLPLTGAAATTLIHCLHKGRCSAILAANGVPVPTWRVLGPDGASPEDWSHFPAIVKPAAEDASNGVHPDSVARSRTELLDAVDRLRAHWGTVIVQEFVSGREINVGLVGEHVLPLAEIDFRGLPEGQPSIVSYAAKWSPESPEYRGTRPVCPAPLAPHMRDQLIRLATRAWDLVDGCGYGRVDLRVNRNGRPYVIDVNPNPDLSPDAGLPRQARVAGWSYQELIKRIVEDALTRVRSEAQPVARTWIHVPPSGARGRTA